MSSANANAIAFLQDLVEDHFWGFITFKLENGQVVHLRREENMKPNELVRELPGKNRMRNHDNNAQS